MELFAANPQFLRFEVKLHTTRVTENELLPKVCLSRTSCEGQELSRMVNEQSKYQSCTRFHTRSDFQSIKLDNRMSSLMDCFLYKGLLSHDILS
jgi:hypothetical protein